MADQQAPSINLPPNELSAQSSDITAPRQKSRDTSITDEYRGRSQLQRPSLGGRKSSGTIIIPRDSPTVELTPNEEVYEEGDARAMSPRRSNDEIEEMGEETRTQMEEQAKNLQANLLEIVERVESVKSEHEKLEGRNKFLQK